MPLHKTSQKEKAKYIYLTTEKTQKEIADMVGVTAHTLSAWVRKGEWARIKRETFYSPEQEIHNLYEELRQINKNIQARPPEERYSNKQELEAKTKILALLSGPLRKTGDKWRNVTPEVDCEPEEESALSGKPAKRQFSAAELRKYYEKVAYWYVMADMGAKKDAGEPISMGGPGYEHILHSEAKQKKREEEEKRKSRNHTLYRQQPPKPM